MKASPMHRHLYPGLYFCFVASILVVLYPISLFESYSLIDAQSIHSLVRQLADARKDELTRGGGKTFGLTINNQVRYELPLPDAPRPEDPQPSSGQAGGTIRMTAEQFLKGDDFKLSTAGGLIDVLVGFRANGSFQLSFAREFETRAIRRHPLLALFDFRLVLAVMTLLLFLRLRPLYSHHFSGSSPDPARIERLIIGLPLFILGLTWTAGLFRFFNNLLCCYLVSASIGWPVLVLFTVSLLMYITLTSLLTLGITQEYIHRFIAAPFFAGHNPYALRSGPSLGLSLRFLLIIFSAGMVPTALGLYLPLVFNSQLQTDLSSLTAILDRFEILVPLLITAAFTFFFILLQVISLLSFRRNIIQPINQLIQRMQRVARGDFDCRSSVLYVDEIGQLKGHFNSMLDGLVERDRIRDTFGRFISPEIAGKLLEENRIDLKGEEIEATILFSDIRSFTPLGEQLGPQGLVEFLNLYFSYIVRPIHHHRGVINKFIGDAVMAVFSPVFGNDNHPQAAVEAALQMRTALADFNALGKYTPVRFGVGIHCGKLIAGNIGTEERMEFTFIGDNVNIASRIESENKNLDSDILISEEVFQALPPDLRDQLAVERCDNVRVKGRVGELTLYKLL